MFENNKILILGMARSGYEAAKFLVKRNNKVVLNDNKKIEDQDQEKVAELKNMGVELVFGSHPDDLLDDSFDYLIKNPGVPINHKYVLKAHELDVEVINEAEMTYRLLPKDITLIGITGTNGKTTTTTLTYNILHDALKDRVHLIGNIGIPSCTILDKLKLNDIIVMEVSCQQLENFKKFKPNIGVLTNISPAHIDFLGSYDHYKEVKKRLFINQTAEDIAIINIENEEAYNLTKDIKSSTKYFSSKNEINGCYINNDKIYYYEDEVMSLDDIHIAGIHNIENCMAAIMVSKEFNIKNEDIIKTISNFKGVEHRLEYVDTINGVMYYNDTEATNIKCSQIALSSFTKPTILILGGLERGQDFNELIPFMNNVKVIIGIGQCRERVKEFGISLNIDTYIYETLKEGFKKCVEEAVSGDVVLLSPASASWDQYKECEIRGQEFKDYVKEMRTSED